MIGNKNNVAFGNYYIIRGAESTCNRIKRTILRELKGKEYITIPSKCRICDVHVERILDGSGLVTDIYATEKHANTFKLQGLRIDSLAKDRLHQKIGELEKSYPNTRITIPFKEVERFKNAFKRNMIDQYMLFLDKIEPLPAVEVESAIEWGKSVVGNINEATIKGTFDFIGGFIRGVTKPYTNPALSYSPEVGINRLISESNALLKDIDK